MSTVPLSKMSILWLMRILICVGLVLPPAAVFSPATVAQAAAPHAGLPRPAAALESATEAVANMAAVSAPNACPPAPAGLTTVIERTNHCVFYDAANTTNAQATFVADQTDAYWTRYAALGFVPPLVTGIKLEVRIMNASCNGTAWDNYIEVNNGCFSVSFPGNELMQYVVGHELFHRIQFAYDSDWNPNWADNDWLYEGTARMMEDKTFGNIDSFANAASAQFSYNDEINDYLINTNRDMTSSDMRYESALFWNYFAEQFGTDPDEPELGVDAIATLWDAVDPADDIAAVNTALSNLGAGVNFDEAFRRFTATNWLKDLAGASATYNYVDEDQAGNPMPYGPITPDNGGTINAGSPANFSSSINRYGAKYYRATVGNSCPVINATFNNNTASDPAFFHVITEKSGALDYFETSTADSWTRSFFNDGISHVTAVAGSTDGSANVNVTFQCLNPVIDVKLPNNGAVSNVGPFNGPGKFLAQVLVTDGSPTGPVVDGLSINDFKATVNGLNALVTTGGFIQEQYWLVVQAPLQAADGTYDLEVRLEESGTTTVIATDINPASVTYNANNVDHLLVLDRSGSMNSDGKFVAAQNAANFYIDITRNNDGLAVVPYHTDVDPVPFSLRPVTTVPNVRVDAENYVDALTTGNLTSIGDGMLEAANQRNASPTANPLCSFVLLSDGIQTEDLYWDAVKADVIATGCPVTTIAFGQASDETLMQDIATETGGLFFYNDVFVSANAVSAAAVDGTNAIGTLADMNLALGDTYEYAQGQGEGRVRLMQETGVVPILQSEFDLPPDQIHKVFIDETINEAIFSLDWHSINEPDCDNSQVSTGCFGKNLALKLVQPDGKEVDPAQLDYTFEDIVSGHVGWRIANPMPGEWTLIVNADSFYVWYDIPYQVIVSGPSTLTAELLLPDRVGSRYETGNRVPIHAFVSSNQPTVGAVVIADVTAPNGAVTPVRLYDDGQHDDGNADDGFYAGIYTQVNQAERVVDQGNEDGGTPFRSPLDEGAYRVRLRVTLGQLQREALGSFSVQEGPDENLNGLPDNYERENGIDNVNGDADLDGLTAVEEYQLGTDPNNSDTDGGGENDGSEFHKGQNPLHPKDDNINAPDYLKVIANVGFNEVQYDVKAGYVRLILYRAISPNGPWILQNSELPADGRFEDQAENGVTYYYRYLAFNEKQHGSAIIDSVGVTPSEDPFAPEATMLINDGAAETNDLNVALRFVEAGHAHLGDEPERFDDIAEMKISNEPDLGKAEWQTFEPNVPWTLAPTKPGELTKVYAQFRDTAGNESTIDVATIRYVESIVTPTITPTVAPTGTVTPQPSVTPVVTPTPVPGDVKIDEIDLDLHRRAAQFLEEMRGGPMAPGWDDALLSEMVRPLCRPDVDGAAYYEFPVVKPDGSPAGFIILATGDHDYPIAHWNYEGETPTQHVERVAAEKGKKVAKFFKLDTLSYAGEDENGELVAMPGTPLVKVTGLSADLLKETPEPSDETWTPSKETTDDTEAEGIDGTTVRTGPQEGPAGMELGGWESWQELKAGYAENYALFIADLKQIAAEDWEVEHLAREFGEGLLKGQTYNVSLLYEKAAEVKLSGEGSDSQYVETEVIAQAGMPAILRIKVLASEEGKELDLSAEINYGEVSAAALAAGRATIETIKFTIVQPLEEGGAQVTPTSTPVNPGNGNPGLLPGIYLPFISSAGSGNASVQSAAVNGAWGPWNYFWAGNGGDQRLYSQIPEGTAPNSSNCWSGCGGTAWAMLFGWADNQAAEGNSYWSSRWGLYRENGGTGANAVAPSSMDNGVRNMTWEIRNDVDTWCAFGSGPTNPWDMDEASGYFVDRTGTKLSTHYNVLGIHENRLREYARDSIIDRNTPAIIGTGWLTHYPLAYGYAWRSRRVKKCFIWCWHETQYNRSFYVNQGWGGSDNGWVSAGTWFAGEIRP